MSATLKPSVAKTGCLAELGKQKRIALPRSGRLQRVLLCRAAIPICYLSISLSLSISFYVRTCGWACSRLRLRTAAGCAKTFEVSVCFRVAQDCCVGEWGKGIYWAVDESYVNVYSY